MIVIVDASVAIKWFLLERYSRDADRWLEEKYKFTVPDFIVIEISNVLWKKRFIGELERDECFEIDSNLQKIISTIESSRKYLPDALEKSLVLNHPVYDCVYLAMAVAYNTIELTADRQFYERVKNSKWANHILWIEDDSQAVYHKQLDLKRIEIILCNPYLHTLIYPPYPPHDAS